MAGRGPFVSRNCQKQGHLFDADPSPEKETQAMGICWSTEGTTVSLDIEGEEQRWPEMGAVLDDQIWGRSSSSVLRSS